MLRRQKWLLIVGGVLIVGLIVFMSVEYNSGFRLRSQTRYESSIQMAVVPEDFDSLANALSNVGAMAGTTALYATLLSSSEAAVEISEESGVVLLDTLRVTTSGRDGFMDVKATAGDAEGAITAALHSFEWLERRIVAPPSIVRLGDPPVAVAAEASFVGTLRLEASPSFVATASTLWIRLTTSGSEVLLSLADAGTGTSEHTVLLEPEGEVVVALEDVHGDELDSVAVSIPALPDPASGPYDLVVRLDRGVLLFAPTSDEDLPDEDVVVASDVQLLKRHINVSWQESPLALAAGDSGPVSADVGLLLLTEAPVAGATGGRRGPILAVAALVGGLYVLIVVAVGTDSWTRAKQQRELGDLSIAEISDNNRQVAENDIAGGTG
jgi:hypothetical protein